MRERNSYNFCNLKFFVDIGKESMVDMEGGVMGKRFKEIFICIYVFFYVEVGFCVCLYVYSGCYNEKLY